MISNIVVMFFLNWLYAVLGMFVLLTVFGYLIVMAPARNWGEVSQALMFHQVCMFSDSDYLIHVLCRFGSICCLWTQPRRILNSGAPTSC